MEIEYSYYDIASNDEEVKLNVNKAINYPIVAVSVLPSFLKCVKPLINSNIRLSSVVDYPLGIMDSRSRLAAIEYSIKAGANIIEIVAPSHPMCNRKYEKIRDDIKSNLDLCLEHNVELRYTVDYRVFSYDTLYKIAQIFLTSGISTLYPSTSNFLDDINDNIIASVLINKKVPKIKIICTGNLWNNNQATVVKKTDLYGIKVNSINGLDLLTKKL